MLSDSISEGVNFQNFLGGMPPDPPRFGMLCMPACVLCTKRHAFYNLPNDFSPPPLLKTFLRPCHFSKIIAKFSNNTDILQSSLQIIEIFAYALAKYSKSS